MSHEAPNTTCPSCGSSDVIVYRQPTSKFSVGGAQPTLRCNACGARSQDVDVPRPRGIPVLSARMAPRPELPKAARPQPPLKKAPPRPEPSQLRKAQTPKRPSMPVAREKALARAAAASRQAAEAPKKEAPKKEAAPAAAPEKQVLPSGDVKICAWAECENAARKGSKYCSRECSNRNARARYQKRKNKGDRSAA